MKLENKVALITGGANGIGAAAAEELARRGADIAIADLETDRSAAGVKADVENLGRKCVVIPGDMGNPEDAARCVQEAVKLMGGIDVLIHCAGGAVPGGVMEVTSEAWYNAFDVHVHAVFHLCRAALPYMKQRGEGAIVLVSSAAGLRGCLGAVAYAVVKGAIPPFVRALARELADSNIRVNAIAPGIIRTRFQDYLKPEQVKNNIENRIPLHREGRPQDAAELIAALVTNDFITGETIPIDGGMTMRIV